MKTILLAGGMGTRLMEETATRPKPMVEIGGQPVLWHLMQLYASHGFKEFLIACGYKGEMIKEYFRNLPIRTSDYVLNLADGSVEIIKTADLDWKIGAIDTGIETSTAGRILRMRSLVSGTFMVTYGDGLGDVDLTALVDFHRTHGRLATVTAVRPPARFGALTLDGARVREFAEKPQVGDGWINGGFFVFEPAVFDYLGEAVSLERQPLEQLAAERQLMAFRHEGFWQPMDTLRERQLLEALWQSGKAPWVNTSRSGHIAASS
jgi:glucose-1-phosphate cytidylyltransferase